MITPSSSVTTLNAGPLQAIDDPLSPKVSTFIADELFPMMISFWPASSKSLDANILGSARAYGLMLRGLSPPVVREEVVRLSEREPERVFAPTPQELRKLCLERTKPEAKPVKLIASMSSLEMQVCAKCLRGEVDKTASAINAALDEMISEVLTKGGTVEGRRGSFAPLNTMTGVNFDD